MPLFCRLKEKSHIFDFCPNMFFFKSWSHDPMTNNRKMTEFQDNVIFKTRTEYAQTEHQPWENKTHKHKRKNKKDTKCTMCFFITKIYSQIGDLYEYKSVWTNVDYYVSFFFKTADDTWTRRWLSCRFHNAHFLCVMWSANLCFTN